MLSNQKKPALKEKRTASQVIRKKDQPIEPWIPKGLKTVLKAVVRVEKRAVATMEAARMKREESYKS